MSAHNACTERAHNAARTPTTPAHSTNPRYTGVVVSTGVELCAADLPADLGALRQAIRSTFGGGLTYLLVKTPDGLWAGGKHQGGGCFNNGH